MVIYLYFSISTFLCMILQPADLRHNRHFFLSICFVLQYQHKHCNTRRVYPLTNQQSLHSFQMLNIDYTLPTGSLYNNIWLFPNMNRTTYPSLFCLRFCACLHKKQGDPRGFLRVLQEQKDIKIIYALGSVRDRCDV